MATALGLAAYNMADGMRAAREAERVLLELSARMDESPDGESFLELSGSGLLSTEVDGNEYIGVLEIPALGRRLPVAGEWSYAALKTAPCRYTGTASGGDLIVAAHNYPAHFGGVGKLVTGDRVTFTDLSGVRYDYQVVTTEQLSGTDVNKMQSGDWALTLFTCTIGGKARVTVRCARVEDGES